MNSRKREALCAKMCTRKAACEGTHSRTRSICANLSASFAAVLLLAMALFLASPSMAQVQNGSITGRVTDPSGAVIPGATVTVSQGGTGLVLHGASNSDGTYNFSQLQPAQYSVTVEKPGFKRTGTSVTLTVGQTAQVDLTLPVGNQSETVNVAAEASVQMDTQTSNLDYTVQSQQVDDLPMNGRNAYGLAALSPGIVPGQYFGVGVAVSRGAVVAAATNNFESNGGIGGSNEVLLDGVSIVVCCQGQPAVTPTAEVVSQFKVVSSDPPAQYGRTSGAVLNIVTKTGTNSLHGDAYDFLRNNKLDAANFFTKRNGVYPYPSIHDFRAPHRENQFGAFAGGPVYVPRLYSGKDRTFFTFGYEGIRNVAPTVGTTTVPTTLMREGIFTEAPAVVYDPNSYNSGTGQRTPIAAATCNGTAYGPGLCVPTFDPVAKAFLALMPAPNLAGTVNNYSFAQNTLDQDNQYNFRIDHNFSDKQRTFIRGTKSKNDHVVYDIFNQASGPNGWQQHLTAYLFALGHVWTINPNTLMQFSYGFARQTNYQLGNNFFQFDATKYGFSSNFAGEEQIAGLPLISISGLQAISFSSSFNLWAHYVHSLNASLLLQRGKHSLAIGYNGKLILENQKGLGGPTGSFTFNTAFTGGPTPNSALPSGQSPFDSWAAFLLGYPGSGAITRQTTVAFNQWVSGIYLQDDWRFTPKLTLNLGLRYDLETGFHDRHNNWADFDPNVTSPLSAAAGIEVRGGAVFLGVNGNPSRTTPTFFHEVAPRLGFSYSLNDLTVVRGGYGLLFLPTSERGYGDPNIGFTQNTNIATSANGFTPAVTIDNPFPGGVALPAGPAAGVGVSAGSTISGFQYNNPVSYQQQWNFGIERGLARDMTVSVYYVGGHGVHLPMNPRPNDLQPQYYGPVGDPGKVQTSYLQAQVPNPFYGASGIAPGSLLLNPTVQRVQLLSEFPQYTGGSISSIQNGSVGTAYLDFGGSATYNAFQATWLVHHASGLSASVSYIRSKLLGDVSDLTNGFLNTTGNPGIQSSYFIHSNEHSNLVSDIPERVTSTATYPLPFGRGKRFGAGAPGWANQVIGGWTLTTIIDAYSGFPLSMTVSGTSAFAGTRPMYVSGASQLTSGSTHQRLGGAGQTQSYLNPAGFALPLAFQLGNVPRSAGTMRGPLSFDDNASVIKYFPIHEDLALEIRAEAFNVLNKVDFGLPATTVGGGGFGNITSQYNLPRNVQLAAKLHF
jgi:hypothetical protein